MTIGKVATITVPLYGSSTSVFLFNDLLTEEIIPRTPTRNIRKNKSDTLVDLLILSLKLLNVNGGGWWGNKNKIKKTLIYIYKIFHFFYLKVLLTNCYEPQVTFQIDDEA